MPAAFLVSALVQFTLALVVAWILGPSEFGAYALALAAAILGQTLLFEWLRLAATRFHASGERGSARRLARALNWLGAFALLLSVGLYFASFERRGLLALLPLLALTAGVADFRAALMRAEFDITRYASFMAARNLFAACLMPLAALRFGSAEAGILAFLLAILAAIAVDFVAFRRRRTIQIGAGSEGPDLAAAFAYAAPIVATNCLYLLMFFGLRAGIALTGGVAEAGQFALPLEFTMKLFTTVGTALDLLLFQLAVRDDRERGAPAGLERLARNGEIMLALVLPMALGLFLVAPRLEAWLAAPEFRGPFATYLTFLLPGIAAYALVQYVLHPHFQLRLKTLALVGAALAAAMTAGLIFLLGARLVPALPPLAGLALGCGMAIAAGILAATIGRAVWPRVNFVLQLTGALGLMALTVHGVAQMQLGAWALIAEIVTGGAVYAVTAWRLDLAGLRGIMRLSRPGA